MISLLSMAGVCLLLLVLCAKVKELLVKYDLSELARPVEAFEEQVRRQGTSAINSSSGFLKEKISIVPQEMIDQLIKIAGKKIFGEIAVVKISAIDGHEYSFVISENPDHPFQVTSDIIDLAQRLTAGLLGDEAKTRAIFDWMVNNINYGRTRLYGSNYRHPKEVFKDCEGVCGEMALLYIVMVRSLDIKSRFVFVNRDYCNKKVDHACAVIWLNGKECLVDPAYKKFDIKHIEFEIKDDVSATQAFKTWRQK